MTLLEFFDSLPKEKREEIFAALSKALKHRGGGLLSELGHDKRLCEIADLFAAAGMELEQHT